MKVSSLLPFACFLVYSCHSGDTQCSGKQVSCPAFDDALALQWIPYKLNDGLIFKSENITDTFILQRVAITGSHDATVNGSNPDCSSSADFYSSERVSGQFPDGMQINIADKIDQYTSAKSSYVIIEVKDGHFYGLGFSDTGLINGDLNQFHSLFYSSLSIGNNNYQNVQSWERDTIYPEDKSISVYKIWLCKNKGIVAYEDYPQHNLWIKQ